MPSNTSTTTTVQELAPEQRDMLDLVMPAIEDYANADLELYKGLTTPTLTDAQRTGNRMLRQVANNQLPDLYDASMAGLDASTSRVTQANRNYNEAMGTLRGASDTLGASTGYLNDVTGYLNAANGYLGNASGILGRAEGQLGSAAGLAGRTEDWLGAASDASMDLYNRGFGMGSDILNAIAEGNLAATQKASDFLLDPAMLSPDNNPWMEQYANAARQGMQDDFMREIMPALSGAATTAGQVGSSRAGIAQGIAAGDLSRDMSTLTADIYNTGYGNQLNALTRAYGDTIGVAGQAGSSLLDAGVAGLLMQPDLIAQQNNLIGQQTDIGRAMTGVGDAMTGIGVAQTGVANAGINQANANTNIANAQTGIGDSMAGVASGRNDLARTQLAIASAYPELADLAMMPGEIYQAIGQQQYMIEQARNTERANKFMTDQQMPFLQAMDIANLAFGMPVGQTVSTSSMPTNPLNMIMGLGSLFMGLPFF